MDPVSESRDLKVRLDALEAKLDATFRSAEKTRKYLLWTGIITAAIIILPLFFLPFALSSFLSTLALPAGF